MYKRQTQTFTLDVSDKHVRANCAVYDALNNIYAMGAGPIAVSYTHLDVYKRQALGVPLMRFMSLSQTSCSLDF